MKISNSQYLQTIQDILTQLFPFSLCVKISYFEAFEFSPLTSEVKPDLSEMKLKTIDSYILQTTLDIKLTAYLLTFVLFALKNL